MRIPRIFYAEHLKAGIEVVLDEEPSRHILQVLRLQPSSHVILFNNTAKEFDAELISVKNKHAILKINTERNIETESPLKIHLIQGMARGEKMDWIIQKATELGVYKITPVFSEYCNVKLDQKRAKNRLQHWQSIIISACEQSGRGILPVIDAPQDLQSSITHIQSKIKLLFDPDAQQKLSELSINNPGEIAVLIGPEGGLSPTEVDMALKQNFTAVRLGPRILRTETAPVAVLGILQAKYGDF